MLQSVGFPVMKLSRERFGNLDLTGLQPGEYREIRPRELQDLKRLANG